MSGSATRSWRGWKRTWTSAVTGDPPGFAARSMRMGEPLKTFFSAALVRRLADDLRRADSAFSSRAFIRQASGGLDDLELLDRGKHIASALAAHLPPSYPRAVDVLLKSLGPEHASDELIGAGMAPFYYLPHTIFVAEHGLDDFETSMQAQYELTKRFSAEASIRPFIAKYPERTFERLRTWTTDANPHVRRLVSEGTRLRLPWAMRVTWLDEHPEQVVGLLELLKDDPASVVRRSVANNLNDLGKVHPQLLYQTCERWLQQPSTERRALVEHALRSAVKRGESGALRLVGFGSQAKVALEDIRIAPRQVKIGDRVSIGFALRSRSRSAQQVLVDLAVHFAKASGRSSRKVFKVGRALLPPGGRMEFATSVSLGVHTTRKPHPGRHHVEVLVNGRVMPLGAFTVRAAG